VLLSVAQIAALNEVLEFPGMEAAIRVGQLKWPQEVAGLLEIWSNSEDFMNQILHTDDAVFAQIVLDQLVVGKSHALLVNLAIASLVDELADTLQVGITICNVWIDDRQHLLSGLRQSDKDTIVDLEESEQLKDLARLGSDFVDTLDSDDEDQLGLFIDIERTILLS